MNVQCHACIGGTSIEEYIRKLDYGQHVVSGTPGEYLICAQLFGLFLKHLCVSVFHSSHLEWRLCVLIHVSLTHTTVLDVVISPKP